MKLTSPTELNDYDLIVINSFVHQNSYLIYLRDVQINFEPL
jgi:hypothetical protein